MHQQLALAAVQASAVLCPCPKPLRLFQRQLLPPQNVRQLPLQPVQPQRLNQAVSGAASLIGAAALGFMALANMLGLGEGFAQILMFLALAALALFAFRFFAAKKAASSAGNSSQNPTNIFQRPLSLNLIRHQSRCRKKLLIRSPEWLQDRVLLWMSSLILLPQALKTPTLLLKFLQNSIKRLSFRCLLLTSRCSKVLGTGGDMDNLSNYCTDDMFIELTHRRREIKGANVTMILSLTPSLAGFETTPTEYVASVLFEGKLNENGEPTDVKEIWNLVKPREGKSGWLLAGIEQAE